MAAAYRAMGAFGRDKAIKAVAERVVAPEELELFRTLMNAIERASKDRHRLAHWVWAYTPSLMDAFVLFDPADVLKEGDPSPQARALVFSVSAFTQLVDDHRNLMTACYLLGHAIGIRRSLESQGVVPPTTPKRDNVLARARELVGLCVALGQSPASTSNSRSVAYSSNDICRQHGSACLRLLRADMRPRCF